MSAVKRRNYVGGAEILLQEDELEPMIEALDLALRYSGALYVRTMRRFPNAARLFSNVRDGLARAAEREQQNPPGDGTPVQVALEKDGEPVTDVRGAKRAMDALGFPRSVDSEVDADVGVWLVLLPPPMVRKLEREGYIEISRRRYTLTAEMP